MPLVFLVIFHKLVSRVSPVLAWLFLVLGCLSPTMASVSQEGGYKEGSAGVPPALHAYSQTVNQLLYSDESELNDVWRNGLMSGLQAAGANAVAHTDLLENELWDNPFLEAGIKPWAHGAVQGGIGALFGEDFDAGFRAGVASSYAGGITQALGMGINDSRQITSNLGQAIAGLNGADPNFGRQIGENVWEYNDIAGMKDALGEALDSLAYSIEDVDPTGVVNALAYVIEAGGELGDEVVDRIARDSDAGEKLGQLGVDLTFIGSVDSAIETYEEKGLTQEAAVNLVIDQVIGKIPFLKGKGDEILGAINKRVGAKGGGNLVVNPKGANRTPASFFGNTKLEVQALQQQGLSRSEAFQQVRSFNAGNAEATQIFFCKSELGIRVI